MSVRTILIFAANLPWTMLGLVLACLSGPKDIIINRRPPAIIIVVASFWWYNWLPGKRRVRAITNGHVIQLGPLELDRDLDHELVHVEQAVREPFIHPFLYLRESYRHGYKHNKYEQEAYSKAGNVYAGGSMDT